MEIQITKTTQAKTKPNENELGFGRLFSDHMFLMEAVDGVWQSARIVPYGPLAIDPASTVLHYAQETFEGLKAYRAKDGRILLFRAMDNFRRLNKSCARVCLPELDADFAYEALVKLVGLERDWVPSQPGTSLYLRPFMFGNDAKLGVDKASNVQFCIICSPSGAYYATGLAPVRIYVEDEYVRAVRGGLGFAKTGANYAASLLAGVNAHEKGFSQVLWLDGIEHKYVEEVGAMNIFFRFRDELVTPALQGSILPGITRQSILTLAEEAGVKAVERQIAIAEVADRAAAGELLEVFGSGTAAVVSPVGELVWGDKSIVVNGGAIGELTQKLYDTLTGLQFGVVEDTHSWITEV